MANFLKPLGLEKIWAKNGDKSPPPDDAKIDQGFTVEIPFLEDFNYLEGRQDEALAHINQYGICAWDIASSYLANKSYVQGTDGIIYRAIQDSVGVDPVGGDETKWKPAFYFREDLYTIAGANAFFSSKNSNLSDLTNTATARNNLGVYSTSETDARYNIKSNNLSDVTSAPTAFNNIKQQATEASSGTLSIANITEVTAGTDNTKVVTPQKLKWGFQSGIGSDYFWIRFPSWLNGFVIAGGLYTAANHGSHLVTYSGSPTFTQVRMVANGFADSTFGRGDTSISCSTSGSATSFISNWYTGSSSNMNVTCWYLAFGT